MAWLATLDARARLWPSLARWLYALVKWSLVALGAWCLVGALAMKWGGWATAWLLIVPLLYGVVMGLFPSGSLTPPRR